MLKSRVCSARRLQYACGFWPQGELWQREQWYNDGGKCEKSAAKITICMVDVSSNEMVQPLRLEVRVGVEVFRTEWRCFYMGNTLVGVVSTNNNT